MLIFYYVTVRNQTLYPTAQKSINFNGHYPAADVVTGQVIESGSRAIAGSSGHLNGLATWISVTLPEKVLIKNIRVITYPSWTGHYFNQVKKHAQKVM